MNTADDIKDVLELARIVAFGCGIVAPLTERISHCLREHRIPIAALFGVLTKPPPEWNIAIGSQLPTPHGARLLSAPLNFDFAKLSFSPSVREADEAEDVYVEATAMETLR
ncbi:hypothetical protein [Luteibacter sp. CQ10]|uniref:hypothetical protein n=1 Tax=Luteibacter sp. CQ10 TaxID=2805821 RepID=UPI0034A51622